MSATLDRWPLFDKDLRLMARDGRRVRSRMLILLALAALILGVWATQAERRFENARELYRLSSNLYVTLRHVIVGFVALLIPAQTVLLFAREHEQRTFSLLTLTPLSPRRYIVQKFLGGLWQSWETVLVVMAPLGLLAMAAGFEWWRFLADGVVLVMATLVFGAVAAVAGARLNRASLALMVAYVIESALIFASFFLWGTLNVVLFVRGHDEQSAQAQVIAALNPWLAQRAIALVPSPLGLAPALSAVILGYAVLTTLLLWTATRLSRRAWHGASSPTAKRRMLRGVRGFGDRDRRRHLPVINQRPLLWRELTIAPLRRNTLVRVLVVLLFSGTGLIKLVMLAGPSFIEGLLAVIAVEAGVLGALLAFLAVESVSRERDSGTLSLLCISPVDERAVLRDKRAALMMQTRVSRWFILGQTVILAFASPFAALGLAALIFWWWEIAVATGMAAALGVRRRLAAFVATLLVLGLPNLASAAASQLVGGDAGRTLRAALTPICFVEQVSRLSSLLRLANGRFLVTIGQMPIVLDLLLAALVLNLLWAALILLSRSAMWRLMNPASRAETPA